MELSGFLTHQAVNVAKEKQAEVCLWDRPGVQRAGTGGSNRSLTQLQSMPPQHLKTQHVMFTSVKLQMITLQISIHGTVHIKVVSGRV